MNNCKNGIIGIEGANAMHTNTHIITNGLDLGEDRQGKGRYFTSKFLEPGLAKYDEPIGTILLDKETIDKFITSFKGCPVIIDHKDITDDTAKDERVGVVSNVWYNAEDGWYYCDGVIFDKNAQGLITNAGYTVSCAYSFNTDEMSGTWHNNPYDSKVVSGDFLHLALVPVPRYEDATIALNSKAENQPRDEKGRWTDIVGNETYDESLKDLGQIKTYEIDDYISECAKNMNIDINELITSRQDTALEKIKELMVQGTKLNIPYLHYYKSGNFNQDGLHRAIAAKSLGDKSMPVFVVDERNKAENEINLDEPDARIEKDEDMKLNQLWQLFNKKEAMNKKGENEMAEKVDKRKLIDEIGGILKGKVDDELIRTIIKKAEEIGYEDSEKSADNKAKNEADEDDKDEDKKEEKAENKCAKNEDEDKDEDKKEADNEDEDKMEEMKKAENSMDKMRKAYNSSNVQVKSLYTPQSERVELGKQLF